MEWSSVKEAVAPTASGSSIRMSDGVLRVDVATGERVTIFNLKGLQVLTATESLTLDFDHLPKGVYIVKGKKVVVR